MVAILAEVSCRIRATIPGVVVGSMDAAHGEGVLVDSHWLSIPTEFVSTGLVEGDDQSYSAFR